MKRIALLLILAIVAIVGFAQSGTDQVIAINGITTHYTTAGPDDGPAAIMVHGNGGSYRDMASATKVMAEAGYHVFALDSRGQGQNAPLSEYHYVDMAHDVNAFIEALHIEQPVVLGFSDGGIIAIELALLHPESVKAIATCGANVQPDGIQPHLFAQFKQSVDDAIRAGKQVPALTKMMLDEPNVSPEQLQTIKVPTLIMAGENDLVTLAHTTHIHQCIKGSTMLILGGEDHGSYVLSGEAARHFLHFLHPEK
ncbi:MAG: alpha/beta fold hydrolase [Sodaliphilus sp.]